MLLPSSQLSRHLGTHCGWLIWNDSIHSPVDCWQLLMQQKWLSAGSLFIQQVNQAYLAAVFHKQKERTDPNHCMNIACLLLSH
jgi:hypothetical protein